MAALIIAVTVFVGVSGSYKIQGDVLNWLPPAVISSVEVLVNSGDPDQSGNITVDSHPFTIKLYLIERSFHLLGNTAVAFLDVCSFIPYGGTTGYSAVYDPIENSFTFNNLVYTGEDRQFKFIVAEMDLYQEFSVNVPQAIPFTNPNSSSEPPSSSQGSASSSNSSSRSTSSLPASLKPHLLVESYEYGQELCENTPFTLSIHFVNTSVSRAIENAVITFTPQSNNLQIVGGTNVRYIPFLAAGNKATLEMECVYQGGGDWVLGLEVSVSFEYYDIEGKDPVSGSDKAIVNISVPTVTGMRLERIEIPQEIVPGTPFELGYRLVNTGENSLDNVDISVLNAEGAEVSRVFIGSLEPGTAADSPSVPLRVSSYEAEEFTFLVYYFDNAGELDTVAATFTVTALLPLAESEIVLQESQNVIVIERREQSSNGTFLMVLFMLGILGLAGYIVYFLLGRKESSEENPPNISLDELRRK